MVRAGQDGEGAGEFILLLSCEMHRERGAKSGHGQAGTWPVFDAGGFGEVRGEWVEFEDVGSVGVGDLGDAEPVGSDDT